MKTPSIAQFLAEIDAVYKEPMSDYKGNLVTKESVRSYFLASYRRNLEVAEYAASIAAPDKTILDIGLAYGFCAAMVKARSGAEVVGMEVAENIVPYSRLATAAGIKVMPGSLSAEPCPIPDNSFDVVIFTEVIEHLRLAPGRAILEIRRIMKPAGVLVLTTPNIARASNILRLLRGRNIVGALPDDDAGMSHVTDKWVHLREYTMCELKDLLARNGFSILRAVFSQSGERIPPQTAVGFREACYRLLLTSCGLLAPRLRGTLFVAAQKD